MSYELFSQANKPIINFAGDVHDFERVSYFNYLKIILYK